MEVEKKRFIRPEAILITFGDEDIITISEYNTEDFLLDGDRERWDS